MNDTAWHVDRRLSVEVSLVFLVSPVEEIERVLSMVDFNRHLESKARRGHVPIVRSFVGCWKGGEREETGAFVY